MAKITLATKPKPVVEQIVMALGTSVEISALIDEIGEHSDAFTKTKALLDRKTKEIIAPQAARLKRLSELLSKVQGYSKDETFEQYGEHWEATATKGQMSRTIKPNVMKVLIQRLNKVEPDLGYKVANITLGDMGKYLSANELEAYVDKNYDIRYVKEIRLRRAPPEN